MKELENTLAEKNKKKLNVFGVIVFEKWS